MVGTIVRFYHRPDRLQLLNGSRFSTWTGRGYPIAGGEDADTVIDAGFVRSQTDFVCGAALAVSRKFVETIGPMDEDYFLYFEAIDWAMRARPRFKRSEEHTYELPSLMRISYADFCLKKKT